MQIDEGQKLKSRAKAVSFHLEILKSDSDLTYIFRDPISFDTLAPRWCNSRETGSRWWV